MAKTKKTTKKRSRSIVGRPCALTDDAITEICKGIRAGLFLEETMALVGRSSSTYAVWRKRGKEAIAKEEEGGKLTKEEQLYARFRRETKRAETDLELENLAVVRKAALGWTEETESVEEVISSWTGEKVELTKRRRTGRFSPADARWLLEHRFAARWGGFSGGESVQVTTDDFNKTITIVRGPAPGSAGLEETS